MEDILIDLGNSVSIDTSDVFIGGDQDIVSESEALVGPPGPPGPEGPAGRDGVDGQAATVTVGSTTTTSPGTNAQVTNSGTSSAAVLNFSIPRGNQGEAATVSVGSTTTGAAGSNASVTNSGTTSDAILDFTIPQGIAGNAATITVGSVQTVAPEYPATVSNSGTTSAAVLDFNIPQGIQGVPGQDGQDGAPGQAATVTVGSTTTGSAGTNASVTNSGTSSAAVLDFTIPRGADGADGQDGQDGAPGQAATITVGTVTTGAAGSAATVTNSGTSSAAVFDFSIPQGAAGQNGQDGQDGAPGAAATITVGSTTTGSAGSSASVTNSGTSSAAVLDFVIPRGDTGAAGADGADGADGYSPTATVSQSGGVTTISITDKNGTTTSSITIPTQLSDLGGTVSTSQIANNAVTEAKIDLTSFSMTSNVATLNSTYITSGSARWIKLGRMVLLNISDWTITANIPSNATTLAISNLPKASTYSTYGHYVINGPSRKIRLGFNSDATSMNFFWANGAAATELCGQIIYFTDD